MIFFIITILKYYEQHHFDQNVNSTMFEGDQLDKLNLKPHKLRPVKPPKRHPKSPTKHKNPPKKPNREMTFEEKFDQVKIKSAEKLFYRNRQLKNQNKRLKERVKELRQNQELSEDFTSVAPETTSNPSSFFTKTEILYKLTNGINETDDTALTESVEKLDYELFIGLSVGFCALLLFQSMAVIIGIRLYKKIRKGG